MQQDPAAAHGAGPNPMPAKALAQPVPAQQALAQPVIAQPTAAQAQDEEQLINRLLDRTTELGLTARPPEPQTEPDQPDTNRGNQWQTTGDLNSWDQWQQNSWSWDNNTNRWEESTWKTDYWKDDDHSDRPYIPHLEFPKFDGRREAYADYTYQAMDLKPH